MLITYISGLLELNLQLKKGAKQAMVNVYGSIEKKINSQNLKTNSINNYVKTFLKYKIYTIDFSIFNY